jgi:alkylhydroperoxidase family enzyme
MGKRVKEVSLAEATPDTRAIYQRVFGDKDPVAQPGTSTGSPGDYWTTLALVPDIFKLSTEIVWGLMAPGRKLAPALRELAILRTAIVGNCKFEYSQHLKVAQMPEVVVIPKEKLAAIKSWTTSSVYTAEERAVMAATDELIGRNMIEDATFAELKRHLSDEQIVELFYVITTYRMHGMMLRALHLEFDNDTTARMQEVPAPAAKG